MRHKRSGDLQSIDLDRWEARINKVGAVFGLLTVLLPVLRYRRTGARQVRRRTKPDGEAISWPGMVMAALGYVAFGIAAWRPLPLQLTERQRRLSLWLGSALFFPGNGLYWWGLRTLGDLFAPSSTRGAQLYQNQKLVTIGPYAIVRHPMYLGVLMAATGGLLIFRTWSMVLYFLSAWVVVSRARHEDDLLAAEFGSAWEVYRDKVPGWIPRLDHRKPVGPFATCRSTFGSEGKKIRRC